MTAKPIARRTLLKGLAALPIAGHMARTASAQGAAFPLVVDLDWLANEANGPDLRVLDVSPLHVWRSAHIDSAEHAWWRDTVDPNYPVFGAVLTQGDEESHRQQVLDSLGLSAGDRVVVYDNEQGFRAARLVWFLRFLGFSQAALLNAGVGEWQQRSFSIESASTSSGAPVVDPQQGFYLVTQQVVDRLGTPGFQLVDIRTDDERADDLSGAMPLGQIPDSIRVPWSMFVDGSGHLLPRDRVVALTTSAGLDPARPTVLYGSFGVDTALSWLAFSNAGFTDLQTYDRGWAEWSISPELPREPLS
jgi:thiosulfate/3-mercaptopyruvate sulfurtransferase